MVALGLSGFNLATIPLRYSEPAQYVGSYKMYLWNSFEKQKLGWEWNIWAIIIRTLPDPFLCRRKKGLDRHTNRTLMRNISISTLHCWESVDLIASNVIVERLGVRNSLHT